MVAILDVCRSSNEGEGFDCFEKISRDLSEKGFSVNPCALPQALLDGLALHINNMPEFNFEQAGIGHDRFSIAGWYRINTTTVDRIDLPLSVSLLDFVIYRVRHYVF